MSDRKMTLLQNLNEKLTEIQERLFKTFDQELLLYLQGAFLDVKEMVLELGDETIGDILDDLREVMALVRAGKLPLSDAIRESAYLVVNLTFRQVINNETCDDELAGLAELTRGVKLGDSIGFQVSDHAVIHHQEEMITLFDDDEPVAASSPEAVLDPLAEAPRKSARTGLKMLIADDEIANRLLLGRIVQSYGEHDFAYDGQEVVDAFTLAHADGDPYDIIFLDIMMPNKDGHKALHEVRALEQRLNVPPEGEVVIFMVTCLDSPLDVCKAFFKGYCTDFITKPITAAKIVGKMKEYGLVRGER